MVNQTDLISEVDSSNAKGIVIMDFGVDIVNIVNIVDIVNLGVTVIEMEITRTRDRLKEE